MKIIYVEDVESESENFIRLMRIAADARALKMEITWYRHYHDIPNAVCADAFLMDLMLDGSAPRTIEWIRENHGKLPAIVVLSGYPPYAQDCIQAGAEDFMGKDDAIKSAPILIDRIQLAIVRHRAR